MNMKATRTIKMFNKAYWKQLGLSLMIALSSISMTLAQSGSVSGIITDESGGGLPGATVLEKGTSNGTITDIDGGYTLKITTSSPVLSISFLGYESQEIAVGSRSNVSAQLELDVSSLEEVVVVGYGTQNKASVSGAINSIDDQAFESRAVSNPLAALQGQVPGMSVTRTSGQPGQESFDFKVRGLTSINSTDPLLIVDDVPYTSADAISSLNPNDIETMTVLKDASAAIYGARAAGGVILITTKKGSKGRAKVTYNGRFTLKTPGLDKTLTNTQQYFEMYAEAAARDSISNRWDVYEDEFLNGQPGAISPTVFGGSYPLDQTFVNNNWQDVLWGDNTMASHNISISGATDKVNYRISVGHIDDQGLLQWGENYAKKNSMRANLGVNVTDKLKISTVLSYENETLVEPAAMDRVLQDFDPPYIPVTNPLGQPYSWHSVSNPAWMAELGGEETIARNRLSANLKLEYDILEDLKFVGVVGGKYWMTDMDRHELIVTHYNWDGVEITNSPARSSAERSSDNTTYYNYTGYLNYGKTLGKHNFSLMAGSSFEENQYSFFTASRFDLSSNAIYTLNTAGTDGQNINERKSAWALGSVFGRINYDFDNKYFIEGNVRQDGTSKFAPDYRWSSFGGVSAAWRVSEEGFLDGNTILSNLKLRASYGSAGNQSGIGNYDYLQLIQVRWNNNTDRVTQYYPFGESAQQTTMAYASNMVSFDRTWERVITTNIGADFGLFDDRLNGSFDYFIKDNPNMLISITYPQVLGATAPETNSGHLKTWGYEATLGWSDRIGDVSYNINVVYFDDRNKLLAMEGADDYEPGRVNTREGYPINSYFGYISDGFINTEEQLTAYKSLDEVNQSLKLGDAMYKDLDNNGAKNVYGENGEEGDVVYLGELSPHHNFSINAGLKWKGFDFGIVMQGVGQRTVIRNTGGTLASPFRRWWQNQNSQFYGNTWTEDNMDAEFPRLTLNGGVRAHNYEYSDRLVENAAYIRMKNLIVGYTLPSNISSKVGMQSARIYFSGTDLWEYTPLSDGFDPEKSVTAERTSYYPFYRSFTLGIDITF